MEKGVDLFPKNIQPDKGRENFIIRGHHSGMINIKDERIEYVFYPQEQYV